MINAVIFFWQVHIAKTNVKLTPGALLYTCTTFEPFLFYFFPTKNQWEINKKSAVTNQNYMENLSNLVSISV